MSFPSNTYSRYFSLDGWRAILARAIRLEYRIVPFRDFAPPETHPVLLLRHDLDGPLKGAEAIAELEAEFGVRATFFVQTAGDFYNLLSTTSRALLRRLVALGHEIGLHYESARYVGDADAIVRDLRLLEDLSGQAVCSASQHIPVDSDAIAIERYVANEAYEARFTQDPMNYLSDSLMVWRHATPHDLLDRCASFQLLIHPETWIGGYRDMAEALEGMMREEMDSIATRYRDVSAYYAELLEGRDARDRRFRATRARPPRRIGG